MFEASLMESTGQIRTRSRWFAVPAFIFQALLLSLLALFPYLHPATLPPRNLTAILAPPSAPALPHVQQASTATASARPLLQFFENTRRLITTASGETGPAQNAPDAIGIADPADSGAGSGNGVLQDILGKPQPAPHVVPAQAPAGPFRVSSGVATGQLLAPIRAQYPVIARQAHVQGTVIIHALISRTGQVLDAQVLSGSPLLVQAALAAVSQARYRPYLLSGVPVEVETTINVVFQLNE